MGQKTTKIQVQEYVPSPTPPSRHSTQSPDPKLVLSIIGDSDNFVPKPWRKTVFQSALIDAAQNAGESWIVVRGKKEVGVRKIVSDAFGDYFCREYFNEDGKAKFEGTRAKLPIRLINLEQSGEKGPNEYIFIHKPPAGVEKGKEKKLYHQYELQEEKADLQSIKLSKKARTEGRTADLESEMSELKCTFKYKNENQVELSMRVPVILIVVEGDYQTVKYAADAVCQKNIPIIIVKGSGKAADLIVKCMEDTDHSVEQKVPAVDELTPLLLGACNSYHKAEYDELKENLCVLVNHYQLINVFDVDNDDPLMLSKMIGECIVRMWEFEKIGESKAEQMTMTDLLTKIGLSNYAELFEGKMISIEKVEEMTDEDFQNLGITVIRIRKIRQACRNIMKLRRKNAISKDKHEDKDEITSEAYNQPTNNTAPDKQGKGNEQTINESMQDMTKNSNDLNERAHVVNAKFLAPASLPLYFYCGYQELKKENDQEKKKIHGKNLLFEALRSNRRDYVQVLLDEDFILDRQLLQNLYKEMKECAYCGNKDDDEECLHMSWILKHYGGMDTVIWSSDNAVESAQACVRALLGYKDPERCSCCIPCCSKSCSNSTENEDSAKKDVKKLDLLLWSLFANRPDISHVLWLASDYHLMTALMCTVVLKKLAKKANNVKMEVFSRSLTEHAKLFSDRCLEMLTGMYDQNAKAAMKIVDTEVSIWGLKSTPMAFAYENYEMDFIAHTCPQRRLNRIWYNKLAPYSKPFLKVFFLLMLIAFSAFVMTSIDDFYYRRSIARVWEYFIYFWAGGDLFEELKNGVGIYNTEGKSHRGWWSITKRYLYDFWNAVDLISYIILILALFTRHLWEPDPFIIARRMFAVSLLLMYLRYLQVFLIFRRLGPTLIMIKEMLKDLLYFMLIASLAIVGVGIYYHANLYPNHINLAGVGTWDTWHIWKILYYPYWQLYGESFSEFLEDQEQSNCTSDRSLYEVSTDLERCAEKDPTVPIVSAIYVLISNLLLVNLVIAMFSYTFDAVMANSEKLWRFQRYTIIMDYKNKVPSPFNYFIRPFQMYNGIWKLMKQKCDDCHHEHDKDEKNPKKESKRLFRLRFQKMIASECSSE